MTFDLIAAMLRILVLLVLWPCCALWAQDLEQIAKEKHAVQLSGALQMGGQWYGVQGINPRSGNPLWNLSGNATLSYQQLQAPFAFTVGRQGANVNYPTFTQFGISPGYRWARAHLGWRNMHFSPYTLDGHTFMGAGLELNPGKLRLAGMYGRLRKARDYNDATDLDFFPAVYRRMGYALKVGVGSNRTFVDLIYFRAKDDVQSITALTPDSTTTPAENAVLGLSTRIALGRFVSFYGDGAASIFTRDLRSTDAPDYIKPDPSAILQPRFSSRLNYAFKTGLDFEWPAWRLRCAYERILPQFETRGAYFFANDLEHITLSPAFTLAKGKLRLNTGVGLQRNNLLNNRSETTRRFIGNGALSYNPNQRFGLDANYSNLTINQLNGTVLLTDTVRFAIVTSNYSLTPRLQWVDTLQARALIFNGSYQELNDRNPFTREFANMETWFHTMTFSHTYLRKAWGWHAGLNYNHIRVFQLNTNRYGASAGLNKSWNQGMTYASLSGTAALSDVSGQRDGVVLTGALNLNWTFRRVYALSFFGNILRNQSQLFADYTEFQMGLTFSRRFTTQKPQ